MARIDRRVREAGVYFITTDTWQRQPIFQKANVAEIVLQQILECGERVGISDQERQNALAPQVSM